LNSLEEDRNQRDERRMQKGLRAINAVWSATLALLCMTHFIASAQTPAPRSAVPKAMTQAEVQAAYQSCPVGYYSGPRPGKSRYTNDE
jgi:uncharacterized membrane protein